MTQLKVDRDCICCEIIEKMTSNFSTLVNNQSVSCSVLLKITGKVIRRQKLSSTPVHFENFKLRDQRLVGVVVGNVGSSIQDPYLIYQ